MLYLDSAMTTETVEQPKIIDKYDGKTIRVSKEGYGSRIYRISVEYVEGQILEVTLVPLADDGSRPASTFDWKDIDNDECLKYGELYLAAIHKSKNIARDIERKIDTDFDEEDV